MLFLPVVAAFVPMAQRPLAVGCLLFKKIFGGAISSVVAMLQVGRPGAHQG